MHVVLLSPRSFLLLLLLLLPLFFLVDGPRVFLNPPPLWWYRSILGFLVMSTNQARQSDRTLLSLRGPRFVHVRRAPAFFSPPFLGRNKSRRSVIEIYDVATATTMDRGMISNFSKNVHAFGNYTRGINTSGRWRCWMSCLVTVV